MFMYETIFLIILCWNFIRTNGEKKGEYKGDKSFWKKSRIREKYDLNYKLIIRDCIYGELVKKNLLNMIIKEFGLMDGLKMNKRICLWEFLLMKLAFLIL